MRLVDSRAMSAASPLRVGSVPYLVGRPLDSGLGDEPGIELAYDVPAQLIERLRAGELDVALVSTIELFRRPGYRYLDGLAVAGRGPVGSVQVFLRKPVEEIESVALDPASRTARTLVQVLLAEREQGAPEFIEVAPGDDPRTAKADAWLRIGDAALREALDPAAREVFNPSYIWTQRTGLPFAFAAWIVAPGAPVEEHLSAFVRARAAGMARTEALARDASVEWQLSEEACLHYLAEECLYDLGSELTPAISAFQARAAALGLCQAELDPRPIRLDAHAPTD
jgi:chorismate dehydratase